MKISVTEVTEIVRCTREYFELSLKEDASEYKLFIVESPGNSTLEVYYGSRKLSDFLVVSSYPSGREYSNNKLYIRTNSVGDVCSLIYKTSDGKLVDLDSKIFVKEVTNDHSTIKVQWQSNATTELVILSSNGSPAEITSDLASKVVFLAEDKYSVKWKKINNS